MNTTFGGGTLVVLACSCLARRRPWRLARWPPDYRRPAAIRRNRSRRPAGILPFGTCLARLTGAGVRATIGRARQPTGAAVRRIAVLLMATAQRAAGPGVPAGPRPHPDHGQERRVRRRLAGRAPLQQLLGLPVGA